jgi:hypothetical protein
MKKVCFCAFLALAMLMSPGFRAPAMSDAKVRVNISLPLPRLIFPAPPPLLPIPGAYVYYPPDTKANIFFYHDRWYRPHDGRWYRADDYNGPWHFIRNRQVPRAVVGVPHSYRADPHHYERIPYGQVRRNHRAWERNHHWDRGRAHTYRWSHREIHRRNNDGYGHHRGDYRGDHRDYHRDYHRGDHRDDLRGNHRDDLRDNHRDDHRDNHRDNNRDNHRDDHPKSDHHNR